MKRLMLTCLLMFSSISAFAAISIANPWIRATVPQQQSAGAYLQITATKDTRLVAILSPIATAVEIHEMSMEKDVMKMRMIPNLDVAAGKAIALQPGGMHLMLLDLKRQLKQGDLVLVTLIFESKSKKRETIHLKVPVRPINYSTINRNHH